ncbi:MAG TPA: hypothetical protein VGO00_03160, partial [Kofleriaceae bacterium]|nr:hypothetical protein [Kofleriaceae bacterium]
FGKNVKFTGLLTGAVAGLATITPCAGYVTPTAAAIIGTVSGVVCYLAVSIKNRLKWDDALDVWGVHGVGGVLGTISVGLFATLAVNGGGSDGVFAGGGASLLFKQTIAVLGASVWAFAFTYGMLYVIDKVTPVKVSEADEVAGLDTSLHSEQAYDLDAKSI